MKLFGLDGPDADRLIDEVIAKGLEMDLIVEVPDVMLGRQSFGRMTEEQIFRKSREVRGEPTYREAVPSPV